MPVDSCMCSDGFAGADGSSQWSARASSLDALRHSACTMLRSATGDGGCRRSTPVGGLRDESCEHASNLVARIEQGQGHGDCVAGLTVLRLAVCSITLQFVTRSSMRIRGFLAAVYVLACTAALLQHVEAKVTVSNAVRQDRIVMLCRSCDAER